MILLHIGLGSVSARSIHAKHSFCCHGNSDKMAHKDVGELVKKELARKKEILSARKLTEDSGQDPAPSKDFCQLVVTERGIVWRRWKISVRNLSKGSAPTPTETFMDIIEFNSEKSLQDEIERVLGRETLQRVFRLIGGQDDFLSRLPEKLLLMVVSHLDLSSIDQLSKVNKYLHSVCNSDQVWRTIYIVHNGSPTEEIVAVAADLGWKRVFFMDKIHLRKESSRRQRGAAKVLPQSSSTFLTQTES